MLTAFVVACSVAWLRVGVSLADQAVFFAIDTLTVAGVNQWWRRRWAGREKLNGKRDYLTLVGVMAAATLPPALSGIYGSVLHDWTGEWWEHAITWMLQAFIGYVLVTPWVLWAGVGETGPGWRRWLGRRPLEVIAGAAVLWAATIWITPWLYGGSQLDVRFLAMPFVVWAANRQGRMGTAWMVLFSVLLHARTESGLGLPLINPSELKQHLQQLLDVGLLALLGHALAITIESHRRLRKDADRLALVAKRTGVSVLVTDADGRLTWVNDAFLTNSGFAQNEVLGRKPGDFMQGPETDPETKLRISERLRAGNGFSETILNYRKDGVSYWNQLEVDPVRDAAGRVTGFIGVQTDVTLFRNARQALARERQLKEFIAEAPVALAMLDRSLRYLSVSRRWMSDYQVREENITGVTHTRLLPSLPAAWTEVYARVLATGREERCERDEVTLAGGATLVVRWEVRAWKSDTGVIEGLILFSEDIGERLQADKALQLESERFRLVTQATRDLVWDWDLRSGTQWWNDAYYTFWGAERATFTPKLDVWLERVHEADRAGLMREFEEFSAGDRIFFSHEFRLRRADGVYVACLDRAYALRDEKGRLYRMLGAVEDVSAQRAETERNLVAGKLEATGALAAGIAHDFNNLLATVLLNLELIRTDPALASGSARPLDTAQEAVTAARRVTDRLLAFAQGGSSAEQRVDVALLVRDAVVLALKDSRVRAEYRVSPDLPAVTGEPAQLAQVFQNLSANAREAMDGHGEVWIEADLVSVEVDSVATGLGHGRYVRVRMRDSGPGVQPGIAGRIFDPYFTTKTRDARKGVGLGLTIALAIVRRQRGTLRLADADPAGAKKGAVFEVWLRVADARAGADTKRTVPETGDRTVPSKRLRVLLMDDEEMLRRSMGMLLERRGHEVVLCADGAEAVQAYAAALGEGRRFDVAVLDLTVPSGFGGETAMARLRALDPDVRAIVMSGYTASDVLRDFRKFGFVSALSKPFRLADLAGAVEQVAEPAPMG
jgi:PAS domain S-box-containing protein